MSVQPDIAAASEHYRDPTATASSSEQPSATMANSQAEDTSALKSQYLDVPPHRPRRPSLDSTYSELSELSDHARLGRPLISDGDSPRRPSVSPPPRRGWRGALDTFWIRNKGVFLVLAAMFFGSGMNIGTRLLETPGSHGAPMHPFQILFARQSITAACCSMYGFWTKKIPHFPFGPRNVRLLLVARGLTGFFGVFGFYFSLMYLPLAEATVLTFLAPILTCYACSFYLPGETFSRQQQLASLLSLVGVVVIAQPASLFQSHPAAAHQESANAAPDAASTQGSPTPHQHLVAIGLAMLGVCGAVGAMTSIRAIGTRAHPFISVNYFSTWCSIVSLVCLLIFPSVEFRLPGNALEWALLFMLGTFGFVMQFLLTAGLAYGGQSEESTASDIEGRDTQYAVRATKEKQAKGSGTRATSMLYTQMLFALAGDKIVFHVSPGAMSWVGSSLILIGAIWVAAARDSSSSGTEGDQTRKTNLASTGAANEPVMSLAGGSGRKASRRPEEEHGLMRAHEELERELNEGAAGEATDVLELQDLTPKREIRPGVEDEAQSEAG